VTEKELPPLAEGRISNTLPHWHRTSNASVRF
jgi:hypothetical protein